MVLDQPLKGRHDDRGECYWAIVNQFIYLSLLGYGNNGGPLEAGGDTRLGQEEVEYYITPLTDC